jgi:hypothetical protein
MTNQEFKTELERLIGNPTSLRPFICDGYPLDSEIFIIGINPATEIKENFWNFWDGDKFNKTKWFDNYLLERKDKYHKVSPTRVKIEYLVNTIFKNHKCLETNAYSTATANLSLLQSNQKDTDILSFLIRTIKPKAMFIHGTDPANFIKNELGLKFVSAKPLKVNYESENKVSTYLYEWLLGSTVICATKHLRLTKQDEITVIANNLLKALKKK